MVVLVQFVGCICAYLEGKDVIQLGGSSRQLRECVHSGVVAQTCLLWKRDEQVYRTIGCSQALLNKIYASYLDGNVKIVRICEGREKFESAYNLLEKCNDDTFGLFGSKSFVTLTEEEATNFEYPNEVLQQLRRRDGSESKRRKYHCVKCRVGEQGEQDTTSTGPFFPIGNEYFCATCLDKDLILRHRFGAEYNVGPARWAVEERNHQFECSDSRKLRSFQFSVCFYNYSTYDGNSQYWFIGKGPRDKAVDYTELDDEEALAYSTDEEALGISTDESGSDDSSNSPKE